MLRKWMPAAESAVEISGVSATLSVPQSSAAASIEGKEPSIIDERAIKDTFGDDEATFRAILNNFVDPSEAIVLEIVDAWKSRQAEEVKGAAHKLKSSTRAVGAYALADICVALEAAGKSADWVTIDRLVPEAEDHMKRVTDYIKAM